MARNLAPNHEAILEHCISRTCLTITLANGSVIRVAYGESEVDPHIFLGKLKNLSSLRMGLTKSPDEISGQIDNNSLALGQSLIAFDGALDGNLTEIGAYFENPDSGENLYDEKISGEIVKSQIDDEAVSFKFVSDLDAANYNGETIASEFSDVVVVPQTLPIASDAYSDLDNGREMGAGSNLARKLSLLTDEMGYGRYVLPYEMYMAYLT